MTRSIKTIIASILVVSSVAGATSSFESFGITPPDLFENRVAIAPDAGIIDVQPIVNVIAPVQQLLADLCGNLGTVGLDKQLQFICTARDIVDLTITGINTLNQDLSSAINLTAGRFISSTANALGGALGISQADAGLQNLKNILTNATGQARAALSQGLGKLEQRAVQNLFAYDQRRPLSDPVNLGAMARIMNPEGAEAAISIQKAMTNTLFQSAGSVLTLNQARRSAETLAINKTATGLNLMVNTPIKGTAPTLTRRMGAAVSSREAIQRVGEGIADLMSIMATANSNVNASIAALAEQNVYTLQELQSLVQLQSQKELRELEAAQNAAQIAMSEVWEAGQGVNAVANSAARGLWGLGKDNARGLGVFR
jgi:hypothetical protein